MRWNYKKILPVVLAAVVYVVPAQSVLTAQVEAGPSEIVPSAWADQDPADALYREARQALNSGKYANAADLFDRIRTQYSQSEYTPDSYYWEAFARYKTDDTDELETALDLLRRQERRYPGAATRDEARSLAVLVEGKLAERGDATAAQNITRMSQEQGCPEEEDDVRVMALNALLNMDSERALPILEQVLARRDACSAELRRKAVWLISQQHSDRTTDVLLDVARNDPDVEVRSQAVFWLSQVHSEEAVIALDSILLGSDDAEIQEKAIFALSQHNSQRAAEALRNYAVRNDVPADLREKAIFWIGQGNSRESQQFLRDLYSEVQSERLKDKIIFSISQQRGEEAGRWLLDRALDRNETIKLRKQALFWAGQQRQIPVDQLGELYGSMDDLEMREQVIFVLSQRRESQAVDQLMDIARNESDRELRKKAIFWLGQSKDPRVPEFLLELINRDIP